jgi:hypothetical protein
MTNELAIHEYGNGWKWTEKNRDGHGATYRTDRDGAGLFQLKINNGQERWNQIKGTSQFSLPSNRARAMSKIGRGNIATDAELATLKGNF